MTTTPAPTLTDVLDTLRDETTPGEAPDPDALFGAFVDWVVASKGVEPYPHQEEALLELVVGGNVILATPTGSGKSLVAAGAHFFALADFARTGNRTYYTAPIKALVSEKFFDLCATFGAVNVGMLTGDAAVNARHFFNTKHARKAWPWWTWAVTAALFAAIVWLSAMGVQRTETAAETAMGPRATRMAQAEGFEAARDIVLGRCSMCHAAEPTWDGILTAPKHVLLETDAQIARAADAIFIQAGLTDAMPPANVTYIEPEERAVLRAWVESAS